MRNHTGVGLFMAGALALGLYLLPGLWPGAVDGPVFDRVVIERHTADAGVRFHEQTLPDGGLRLNGVTAASLLLRAYPFDVYDVEGLPDWSRTERYDVRATSVSPNPTPEERQSMVRAMLADHFGLLVRVEPREVEAYDMVVASRDGRLGPRLEKSNVDCAAVQARWQAIGFYEPLDVESRGRHACMAWHNPGQLEADLTMTSLAVWLREFVGRPVVDRTGLSGYYSVTLRLSRRRPAVDTVRDDLGLQLVPSRIVRKTVVVERFEPPAASFNRSSPNSSPSRLSASMTPSVNATMTSPERRSRRPSS